MWVADIGAGTGYFERHFAGAVGPEGRVYAVDVEPNLVEHIGKRAHEENTPNVIALLADHDDPKLPAGSFDVIFICDTWHHLGDRVDYLARLAAALKEGGKVAVVDFRKEEIPVGPAMDHKLSKQQVAAEFEEAGWLPAGESDILPYQYFLMFTPPAKAG